MIDRRTISVVVILQASMLWTGCAATEPYLYSEIEQNIVWDQSQHHRFSYLRAYEQDGQLVVYGRIRHLHGACAREGHVDLLLADASGKVVHDASLPLRRQSSKRRGWYGAGFRTRFDSIPGASTLRLSFDDTGCHRKVLHPRADDRPSAPGRNDQDVASEGESSTCSDSWQIQ